MSEKVVRYDVSERVATVTLNRPRYRNAQSWKMLDELDAALDRAQADRLEAETRAWADRVAENGYGTLRMAKLAVNKMQDRVGFSSAMEAAFADFLVVSRLGGHPVPLPADRRLGGVDLTLRGTRGERGGHESGGS